MYERSPGEICYEAYRKASGEALEFRKLTNGAQDAWEDAALAVQESFVLEIGRNVGQLRSLYARIYKLEHECP